MDADARENYPLWSAGQRRMFAAEERKCRAERERLARDEIAALMRRIAQRYCGECGLPVEQCDCLPFSTASEVTG